jgi:CPA2 family monovalent cation:H+ antiporter-2
MLLIATADAVGVRQMIDTARALNPQVQVAVRTHSDEEAQWLTGEGARTFGGEDELAQAMLRHVLGAMKAHPA